MPRGPRKKSPTALYHIMSRSISEVNLFKSDLDKDYYLKLLKRYKEKYQCEIYAYCLMSNHVHLFINPCGFDISTFMLSLNTAYVCYFNKKYKRHGHLFQGRYASKIVVNDSYCLALSAYIHNNAKDLPGIHGNEESYPYSSYGIYTGKLLDQKKLVNTQLILGYFSKNKIKARDRYRLFMKSIHHSPKLDEVEAEIATAYGENIYYSEKRMIIRYESLTELIHKIEKILDTKVGILLHLRQHEACNVRAFTTYVMRSLCGLSYKEIGHYIGNISLSGVCHLANKGFQLVMEDKRYLLAFEALL